VGQIGWIRLQSCRLLGQEAPFPVRQSHDAGPAGPKPGRTIDDPGRIGRFPGRDGYAGSCTASTRIFDAAR
jgi:hypothetical protein